MVTRESLIFADAIELLSECYCCEQRRTVTTTVTCDTGICVVVLPMVTRNSSFCRDAIEVPRECHRVAISEGPRRRRYPVVPVVT